MYSAERHFVTTAHSQLRLMAANERVDGNEQQLSFDSAISKIKHAARPVQARAVYRAALLCEDVFKRSGSATDMNFRSALARLHSLVGLYTDGLFEIDPEFKAVLDDGAAQSAKNAVHIPIPKIPTEQLKAANQNAATVLQPLLRLVKDEGRADALKFISGNNSHVKAERAQAELKTQQPLFVRFDGLMRQITNHTLSEARARAKNVSISYGADFEYLDPSIAPNIRTVLQQACLDIVRSGLVVTGDLVSSINRSWQISITGETCGQDLVISLSWHGQALPGLREQGKNALQRLNGKIINRENQPGPDDTDARNAQIMAFTCPLKIAGKTARKVAGKTLSVQSQVLQKRVRKG